ncbi:MAG: cyclic nucleotide-binding domain-containing protein [Rhodospirillaceae bacterium]
MTQTTMSDADQKMVQTLPLFEGLTHDTISALTAEAHTISYAVRTLLVTSGEVLGHFFVVLSGRARLFVLTAKGRESIIDVVEPGQSFGEAAMFGNGAVPVNAEVEPGTRLVNIPGRPILNRLVEDVDFARKILESLAHRQCSLIELVVGLKACSASQRLSMALLDWSKATTGPTTIRLPISKAELASRIGITPESLSRAWKRLHSLGVVCRGSSVTISDAAILRSFCNQGD